MGGEMKAGLRTSAQAAIMRAVHGHPGVTRAQVAAEIGIPSGFAAETVARLVAARLVCERPAPSTGRRGQADDVTVRAPGRAARGRRRHHA